MIQKGAGLVVFHKGEKGIEYLLLKHTANYWNFPKGGIEQGERPIDTAIRETREEAGLTNLKILDGFVATEKYFFYASKTFYKAHLRNQTIFKIVHFYVAEAKTKNVKISFEHEGYEWLDFKSAMERFKTYKNHRNSQNILKEANDFILSK